jgi:ankyrin repeat protein
MVVMTYPRLSTAPYFSTLVNMTPAAKLAGMIQPAALKSPDFQQWSRGRGTDVWATLCAAISGDLDTLRTLIAGDSNLANCEYEYFTPTRFAVRENHRPVVEYLLQQAASVADEAGDSLVQIARDRGYSDLLAFLQSRLRAAYQVSPEGSAIAAAIKSRDTAGVRAMIDANPGLVHAADERANLPFHWAVMTRQISLIDLFLQRGADINAARPDGLRPIHLTNGDYHYRGWRDLPDTALQRHEPLIGYLIARGADYDLPTATKLGDLDRVRELLDRDPDLLHQLPTYSYYTGLPLRNAAAGGHFEVVKFLLERGADPNQPEPGIAPQGGALHSAIGSRHWEVVKLLLEHGANPNADVESSGNCFSMAKHVNAPKEICDLIASYGGAFNANLADLPTLAAMLRANPDLQVNESLGDPDRMRLILRYQPDILKSLPDPTPWWSNATPKSTDFARWLFAHGLDPNRRNWLGITMLHRCAAKGDAEIATVYLEAGAAIDAIETEWCSTPLGWAAREGRKDMVEWFLAHGANPNLPEDESWARPKSWAVRRGHEEIAAIL